MLKTLEHHEHAEHLAHGEHHSEDGHTEGGHGHAEAPQKRGLSSPHTAALLVATFAAGLALAEQGAKHAEIRVQSNLIAAADAWAQYQAKSTRETMSKDFIAVLQGLDLATNREVADRRSHIISDISAEERRFEDDPNDGKAAVARRAHAFEEARDHALEQTHAYHNGSAALELGIVLTTASAIIGSRWLILVAIALGIIGSACALAGMFAPEWGAF